MADGKFCKNCDNWNSPFPDGVGNTFGQCDCPTATTQVITEKDQDIYSDDNALFTDQWFGCIHFQPRGGLARNEIDEIPTMWVTPAPDDDDA